MKTPIKSRRKAANLLDTVMFVLHLVLLASLAIPRVLSDTPTFVNGRWRTVIDDPQYETHDDDDDDDDDDNDDDDDDDSPFLQQNMFPENSTGTAGPVTADGQDLQTTPEANLLVGEDLHDFHDSKVWKIVLVTVILLMSLVGALGTAYYMCVWRGGRIHYQPQRVYA